MKYYLVVGEASGDLHASNLMNCLKNVDKKAEFRFLGGDLMQAAGGYMRRHYREMSYMGFIPVMLHLKSIFKNLELCRNDIKAYQPDVVILVDYPGFNLKIAKYVKTQLHIPVYYYISPKIWAWKTYRINSIRKYVDKMFSILPFEVAFYEKHHYPIDYVGNPTVDAIAKRAFSSENFDDFVQHNKLGKKPIIAILAGSRKHEIKDNLPVMLEVMEQFPACQAVIAGAPGIDPEYYRPYIRKNSVEIVFNQTYRLLQQSTAALVTSGTATLETALFRVPQVVCYRTPFKHIMSFVFKHFFHIRYISLVNLIVGRTVVQELYATRFSKEHILAALDPILNDETYRQQMLSGYDELIEILGQAGASQRAATMIYNCLVEAQTQGDYTSHGLKL
ncbi:MAG: lipid-A-disaccharide synthase [Dysgonamonadaceae bacterium]|jgi:lipid-A-disaccharide synthase|nr:lipid-A-disaccharide synthase [Dysgonamonadaceae bacterium]